MAAAALLLPPPLLVGAGVGTVAGVGSGVGGGVGAGVGGVGAGVGGVGAGVGGVGAGVGGVGAGVGFEQVAPQYASAPGGSGQSKWFAKSRHPEAVGIAVELYWLNGRLGSSPVSWFPSSQKNASLWRFASSGGTGP
jgi:hypothetical protein